MGKLNHTTTWLANTLLLIASLLLSTATAQDLCINCGIGDGAGSSEATVTYYHNDLLGSPVAATNENAEILWRQQYRPFGSKLTQELAANTNRIDYTGHIFDDDLNLVYAGARYYDAEIGRFVSIDPVGFQKSNIGSFNKYAYGNNNPYGFVDPNGEDPIGIATELLPAAGRSFAGLAAFALGSLTGNENLKSVALQGLREQRAENASSLLSVVPIPGLSKIKKLSAQKTPKLSRQPKSVGAAENTRGIVAGNIKKLKDKRLKSLGIDAEAVKKDLVGRAGGKFNISVDDVGSVFLTPVRKGSSDPIPTLSTLDELAKNFPLKR